MFMFVHMSLEQAGVLGDPEDAPGRDSGAVLLHCCHIQLGNVVDVWHPHYPRVCEPAGDVGEWGWNSG